MVDEIINNFEVLVQYLHFYWNLADGVNRLAKQLNITPHPDHLVTLKAISKLIRTRLSPEALQKPGDVVHQVSTVYVGGHFLKIFIYSTMCSVICRDYPSHLEYPWWYFEWLFC